MPEHPKVKRTLSTNEIVNLYLSGESTKKIAEKAKRTIQCFANWIYKDKGLYLERKFKEFQREPLHLSQIKDRDKKRTKAAVAERKQTFLNESSRTSSVQLSCKQIKSLILNLSN
ncbi:hypothetical protein [Metabacillus iocasae]|uniref:Uncharacterized protein n=1 Tax=Priestia iocasae TaxID=2291674 RepID=A0ABS2QW67_9BACI|nr:hypothetical protein [Metabacillus iocasae]MBM7703734.1 hypothetical protein [Metabacillus iocasae]